METAFSNEEAAVSAVNALKAAGRLEDVDAGVVSAVLALARAVDSHPERATLWREYRGALSDLREVTRDVDDGSLADLLAELSASRGDSAAVRSSDKG